MKRAVSASDNIALPVIRPAVRLAALVVVLIAALLLAVGRIASAAPPVPPSPTAWVTDTTGFLSETARQTLNARLETYEQASGHQLLVWVGKTTGKEPIEDWTVRAFQAWRVGRKGIDDGLVLFLFADDRTARIEVGYGLEGQVPDAIASRIISDVMIPKIKAGDHDGAVTGAVDQLISKIGGKGAEVTNGSASGQVHATTPPPPARPLTLLQKILYGLLAVIVILFIIRYPALGFYLLSVVLSASGKGGGGGGFGGGGGRSGGGGASGKW